MKSLAIIGTGVAGLACGYFLHGRYALTFYERNDYAGGHSNTITVPENGREIPIDTGFMVYNEPTYPNLTRFFRELGVATKSTDMSFGVQHTPSGLEYTGTSLNGLFAQRRNLLRPRFWRMLLQMSRFNREAIAALEDPRSEELTIGQYVRDRAYGDDFLHRFLVPMSGAVWSTPADKMLAFPALTLLRFFKNHGFLGLDTQHPWRTPAGGSRCYVQKLRERWGDVVRLSDPATRVEREATGVRVFSTRGEPQHYDHAILATHADQALQLLASPTALEQALLSEFHYQHNTTTLHTDPRFMPHTRRAWASWNVRIDRGPDGAEIPSSHYWMNRLQGVSERENYFVSLNVHDQVAPERVLRRLEYHHPLFSLGAVRAQARLPELNRTAPGQPLYFCGSYFKYGFHEDAFTSGLDCARAVTGEALWS